MRLIEYDGENIKVADEAFLVRPIRELYEEDKSKRKDKFWSQMSYMWFMYDPRSPYMYITEEESRDAEVRQQEGLDKDWSPSETLKSAIEVFKKQSITTSALLLEGMRKGIDSVRKFLEEIDLNAKDKNERPIYQVSTMTSALKQVPELAKALLDAEKSLAKDFVTDDRARGSLQKAIGEDV